MSEGDSLKRSASFSNQEGLSALLAAVKKPTNTAAELDPLLDNSPRKDNT
jgi:hypothetical protein